MSRFLAADPLHALLAMTSEKDIREENRVPTTPGRCDRGCWSRLLHAPWGRLIASDDPAPFALLLLFALLLTPLFEGLWLALALVLVLASVIRSWLWCRGALPEDASESEADETGPAWPSKPGENP